MGRTVLLGLVVGMFFVACTLVMMSCGNSRRGGPEVGALAVESQEVADGRHVFMRNCYQCHPGGQAGLGPAINNKPLPSVLMKTQVRNGLGAMPAFSEEEISDDQLDHLMAYIGALKQQK